MVLIFAIVVIVYSLNLTLHTIRNGLARYDILQTERNNLSKLLEKNTQLKNELLLATKVEKKQSEVLDKYNIIDPEARIYIVEFPQEIKYIDLHTELEKYNQEIDNEPKMQKWLRKLIKK